MAKHTVTVLQERVESYILLIRSEKVILDRDLARLYGVTTRVLNQAVKRNSARFPEDFMFQLTAEETRQWLQDKVKGSLRSQNVILKSGRGQHVKYQPYAFTEHGILMLSSVLKSERAVNVNIQIMRTFVRLRQMLVSNAELNKRLDDLENKYDDQFKVVFEAIRQLVTPATLKKEIGFRAKALEK